MADGIAIVGMSCRYPDATTPAELWQNALSQRRAFRRIPPERLNTDDYFSSDVSSPDRTYCTTAAVLEDWEFDRQHYRIPLETFRSVDPAHWLALELADKALIDAGYPDGQGLCRESTAVYIGNTLTAEFSRASVMRLRWPFVRRVAGPLARKAFSDVEAARVFLDDFEAAFKEPFHPVTAETLAGSLSNTIAGRIANHFALNGGAYAIDGACSSSLLAISNGCSALAARDVDVVIAGGVDLSLDPFELVGFAKTSALAMDEMRVYDERSNGFWPGEGCGFVVLMRAQDALAEGRRIYAAIRGWGVSSDGGGGITRPEVRGQMLALQRAYARAGFPIESVGYFEGHGTGTSVGDATEIESLSRARANAKAPAVISSIKASIGHTKAAAGVAGFIKAAMAVHSQVLPPMPACQRPRATLSPALKILTSPEIWPDDVPLRAGVSSMGFGGINAHLVLEGVQSERRTALSVREVQLAQTAQEAEIFLFNDTSQIEEVRQLAPSLSLCELSDLAANLALADGSSPQHALVAASPRELEETLARYSRRATNTDKPRIGFLFPGQGSQNSSATTDIAQREIMRESLAALRALSQLGITADVAIGHSLGEITALCWAGTLDEQTALRIAEFRGRVMADLPGVAGSMAAIELPAATVQRRLNGGPLVIAGYNGSTQTVLSGPAQAVHSAVARFRSEGAAASLLSVSHSFHSPAMAPAALQLRAFLEGQNFSAASRTVVSTVTGLTIGLDTDFRDLLYRQVEAPVLFEQAITNPAAEVDLWIEVGPGRVLSEIVRRLHGLESVAIQWKEGHKRGLLETAAAAIRCGASVRIETLFANRYVKPFRSKHSFLASPCESAPALTDARVTQAVLSTPGLVGFVVGEPSPNAGGDPADTVRSIIAARIQMPKQSIRDEMRLLHDLHLNSITVGSIAAEAARSLGLPPPIAPTEYATSSVAEFTRAISDSTRMRFTPLRSVAGVDEWVRLFSIKLVRRGIGSPVRHESIGDWKVFGSSSFPLSPDWRGTFQKELPFGGVLLLVPDNPSPEDISQMLAAAKNALQVPGRLFAILQCGGASSLARTTFLEGDDLTVSVVNANPGDPRALEYLVSECKSARAYTEATYDLDGVRHERVLSLQDGVGGPFPLNSVDVLLVSGGGKGIASECALRAAERSGAALVILGRSNPAADRDLAANLKRLTEARIRFLYLRADVTDPQAVHDAVSNAEQQFGPITAILHGAGRNEPQLIQQSTPKAFLETLQPKVLGLRHILAACHPDAVKLLIAFGSVIAETGMRGEADYGLANEWLASEVTDWKAKHPHCQALTMQWSVWSGTGMGERLGRIDALAHQGISAIPLDEGVRIFEDAISRRFEDPRVIITGRFGSAPTLTMEQTTLPLTRFLEKPIVYYPGIELVAESEVNSVSDPYIQDHVFDGDAVFPAVMGLEAMAQAALAVTGSSEPIQFTDVRFSRPILIPKQGTITLRLAALVETSGDVIVSLRSSESGFQLDHFRAICHFERSAAPRKSSTPRAEPAAIDPHQDLYGTLLFQSGRFKRIASYLNLTATRSDAYLLKGKPPQWFQAFLPQQLTLGDAGLRDAALHSIQASIPYERILPVSVGRIESHGPIDGNCITVAVEKSHDTAGLTYELRILSEDGTVLEVWHSLRLQRVGSARSKGPWNPVLLETAANRCLWDANDRTNTKVSIWSTVSGSLTDAAVKKRLDGKPMMDGRNLSRAHRGGLSMQVESDGLVGCDLEIVSHRSSREWSDLLAFDGFSLAQQIVRETGETLDMACTRVWCARESLKKAGLRLESGLILTAPERSASGSWLVTLQSGSAPIYTLASPPNASGEAFVLAVLAAERDSSRRLPVPDHSVDVGPGSKSEILMQKSGPDML